MVTVQYSSNTPQKKNLKNTDDEILCVFNICLMENQK